MSKNKKIKRIDENAVTYYSTINQAAADVDTNMENWKVQMLIVDAINKNKKAFKARWQIVEM
jgi:hypothetical protein